MRAILALLLLHGLVLAQPQWTPGAGSAIGTDIEAIRLKALNNARADALSKAGIAVNAADTRLVSESGNELTDFYSKFAESSTRGIILEERVIHESELKRVQGSTYSFEIEIEARIAVQEGERDPTFSVSLRSSRQLLKTGEPITLTVTSTKPGYLTIFDIYRDSLSIVFPNAIDKKNSLQANVPFTFPPSAAYDLTMEVAEGKTSSSEMFIAVVTREDVPFPNLDQLSVNGGAVQLRMAQLSAYAQWLYKIPLEKRSADQVPVMVQ